MAIDAGLLAGPADLSAKPAPQMDFVGSQQKMYSLADSELKYKQEQEGENDKKIIQEYLKSGGNIGTPDGTKRATEELKGRVSPKMYEHLLDFHNTSDKREREIQDYYLNLPPEILKAQQANEDALMQSAQASLKVYEDEFPKGSQVAKEHMRAAIQANLGKLATLKDPQTGQPLIPPDKAEALLDMEPAELKAYIDHSHYGRSIADQAMKQRKTEAEAKRAEAVAQRETAGGPRGQRINQLDDAIAAASALDPADPRIAKWTEERDNLIKSQGGAAGKPGAAGQPIDFGTQEGQAVAAMQKLFFGEDPKGMGAQAVAMRTRIRDLAAQTGRGMGLTDMDMAMLPHDSKAQYKAIDGLTKWGSMVEKSQVNLEKDLDVAAYYADKLSPTDIKKINELVIAGKSQFGDGEAQAYGLAVQKIRSEYMRLQVGPTSNAMLPVEAQQKADQLISTGITAENWKGEIRKAILWEADNAKKSVSETITTLRDRVSSAGGKIQPQGPSSAAPQGESVPSMVAAQGAQPVAPGSNAYASPSVAADPKQIEMVRADIAAKKSSALGAPKQGGPVKITSDAEWEKLAPGTKFTGPDGKVRVKQ